MTLIQASTSKLEALKEVIKSLSSQEFITCCKNLSNSSIGQHIRHIIEMYECLIFGYEKNLICYDDRKRDLKAEQDIAYALLKIDFIIKELNKPNKDLILYASFDDERSTISTNYYRELLYNFEHLIHHEALIRVGLKEISTVAIPEYFGFAPSTIAYKKQCAQ